MNKISLFLSAALLTLSACDDAEHECPVIGGEPMDETTSTGEVVEPSEPTEESTGEETTSTGEEPEPTEPTEPEWGVEKIREDLQWVYVYSERLQGIVRVSKDDETKGEVFTLRAPYGINMQCEAEETPQLFISGTQRGNLGCEYFFDRSIRTYRDPVTNERRMFRAILSSVRPGEHGEDDCNRKEDPKARGCIADMEEVTDFPEFLPEALEM